MSNINKDKKDLRGADRPLGDGLATTTTTVEEQVETTEEVHNPPDPRHLTSLEEKVIRMLHGRSLAGHEALEFAPGASMETRLKLALIEANLLEAFEADALDTDPASGAPRSVIADELER